jgi:hypothetical protein
MTRPAILKTTKNRSKSDTQATKRRKLGPAGSYGSQPQVSESSFAHVLARLNEAGTGNGAPGYISRDVTYTLAISKTKKVVPRAGQDQTCLLWMRRKTASVRVSCLLPTTPTLTVAFPVFQQIDVEDASEVGGGPVTLRMFGVTEVCSVVLYISDIPSYTAS